MFLLQKTKKALLSISDGRASSFFNTFIKIITPPPFNGQRISGAKIRRKIGKFGENKRKSEKIRENQRKTEKIREKSEKNGENQRKTEKNGELSVNFCAYL